MPPSLFKSWVSILECDDTVLGGDGGGVVPIKVTRLSVEEAGSFRKDRRQDKKFVSRC